jgi:maltooligosyltrehalose trehalohydrolase
MHKFEVWAPHAKKVRVKTVHGVYPLNREERGWWRVEVDSAGPGSDYGFLLDEGDTVLPDPRSNHQPHGIHGLSRLIDHGAFNWSDRHWQAPPLSGAVVYELHVGTFTPGGNFDSVAEHLDYLIDLGITHIELMPVNEFPGPRGWGYDGVDLYAPHHAYGGPDGLKRLIDACHSKGLAVILDVVYNHLGPVGNYLGKFGPYFNADYSTPWGPAVNLDSVGSDEVRRFLCDNALMWLRDYHFDGLRLDAVHAFIDRSAIHFLEQLSTEVDELEAMLERHLVLIAESDLNQPMIVTPREARGFGIDAQWNDDFHHALHTVLTGERDGYYSDFGSLADLAKTLRSVFVYDGRYSEYRGRSHGRPVVGLSGEHFFAYLQNHDQIGNRATGERSSHLLSIGHLKIGAALVLLSPFVPMLFQGEEFASKSPFCYFTSHEDPEFGRLVSEGRRKEFADFGWDPNGIPDPQKLETYERSRLDWTEPDREPHACLLRWHKELIALRRSTPDLINGRLDRVQVAFDEAEKWLNIVRGRITLICNLSNHEVSLPLSGDADVLLASERGATVVKGVVAVPSVAVVILRTR